MFLYIDCIQNQDGLLSLAEDAKKLQRRDGASLRQRQPCPTDITSDANLPHRVLFATVALSQLDLELLDDAHRIAQEKS